MDFGVIIIILSLLGLIAFAYRGFSVIMMAPIMALLAASLSGLPHYRGWPLCLPIRSCLWARPSLILSPFSRFSC